MREFLSRLSYRLLGLVVFCFILFVLFRCYRAISDYLPGLDRRLPWAFHAGGTTWVFWLWIVALGLATTLALRRLRAIARRSAIPDEPEEPGEPDGPPRPAPGVVPLPRDARPSDPIYLVLSPSEAAVSEFLRAAGLKPGGLSIRISDPVPAIFLNVARFCCLGRRPEDEATDGEPVGLDAVCRQLRALDPEAPGLRGVFLILPLGWFEHPDALEAAVEIDEDLGTIRRELSLDVPVHLVITGLERTAGFLEFAAFRGGRQAEWGVTLPRSRAPDDDEPDRSLAAFADRMRARCWGFLLRCFPDRHASGRLFGVDVQFQALRHRIAAFCSAAFPCGGPDQAYLRSIDLTATGPRPDEQAYVLYSLFYRISRDRAEARWTPEALAADRVERRRARRLAIVGGGLAAATWAYILLRLGSLGAVGWAAFGLIVVGWAAALRAMQRRWPPTGSTPAGVTDPERSAAGSPRAG